MIAGCRTVYGAHVQTMKRKALSESEVDKLELEVLRDLRSNFGFLVPGKGRRSKRAVSSYSEVCDRLIRGERLILREPGSSRGVSVDYSVYLSRGV